MEIVNFKKQYLNEMAELYAKCYSEDDGDRKWSKEKAEKNLELSLRYFSDFSFVALDSKGSCMGGIFCLVNPYYSGEVLFITSIQVKPEYRKQKVGMTLLENAVKVAKEKGLTGIRFLVDTRKNFPKSWYEKLGFKKSGFVEYEISINDFS